MVLDFESFLNEKVTFKGKTGDFDRIIFERAVTFLIDVLIGEPIDLKINMTKLITANSFGHINLMDTMNSVTSRKFSLSINVNASTKYNISALAHELTHIKQVLRRELACTPTMSHITWKGEPYTSREEYLNIIKKGDIVTYKQLPWEDEAYENQDKLPKLFLASAAFLSLRELNPTMAYIVDNFT